jgi:hypothetical protein
MKPRLTLQTNPRSTRLIEISGLQMNLINDRPQSRAYYLLFDLNSDETQWRTQCT